jgi:DNA-binding NarL/FixJ family response regulator
LLRVLVAEDNPTFQQTILEVLSTYPECEVISAVRDGSEAMDAASRLRPDVALLDVGLPGMGGLEVARRIRASLPGTHVVMLLSSNRSSYLSAASKCGATCVLKDRLADQLGRTLGIAGLDPSAGSPAAG